MAGPTDLDKRLLALLHHRDAGLAKGEAVALPITATSTYATPGSPQAEYTYTREGNPTWSAVEDQLSILEGAPCVAFPSGMAAIAAVLYTQLKPGDTCVMASDGYFAARALMDEFIVPLGVKVIYQPTAGVEAADFAGAALVWIETPSNPGLDVCDIAAVAGRAHAAGARLALDNTTATPLLQSAFDLGVDIVAMADTKAMNGHGDVLFGHVASPDPGVIETVKRWRKLSGNIPGPHEAGLVHRGLETLDVRLERMCTNAGVVAERLAAHAQVSNVRYPGLASDPAHALAAKQMARFGFLIGFELASEQAADAFLAACGGIVTATSFGSVHTSAERRARWGDDVAPGFVRLSVGCEPVEALWAEIEAALETLA